MMSKKILNSIGFYRTNLRIEYKLLAYFKLLWRYVFVMYIIDEHTCKIDFTAHSAGSVENTDCITVEV